ncbi:MAG: hypothetical protein A2189_04255 [Paenibacillus sp. RIFOXYA1_FULL_44_5]|nr:MAG: hypothetical protein A2189_04255 [Paenibacillus sp. RIFOXYA1_FULL_44_5]
MAYKENNPYQNPELPLETRLDDLLSRFTLEEKMALIAQYPPAGACQVPITGGWQEWTTCQISLNGASGQHTVYLKFSGDIQLSWIRMD